MARSVCLPVCLLFHNARRGQIQERLESITIQIYLKQSQRRDSSMLDFIETKMSARRLLLLPLLVLLAQVAQADFRGSLTLSNYEIEATGVTYGFSLRFGKRISDANGKLVIRFPLDFGTFTISSVIARSGFKDSLSAGSALNFQWVQSVRLLTITDAFPSNSLVNIIEFDVNGVTNPKYAATTQPFTIDSYIKSGSEFVSLESSSSTIVVTPTPGSISNEKLKLANPTVGAYSEMSIDFQTVHAIPSTGYLEIQFPKWNDEGTESYVATSTSPGRVPCKALNNIPMQAGRDLACTFTHGAVDFQGNSQPDVLRVDFNGNVVSDLVASQPISFSIAGVRGPPSTAPISGFKFQTRTQKNDIIDQSSAAISLAATQATQSTGANMEVSSDDPSINALGTLTMRVITSIPLKPQSNIQIGIPDDFDTDGITAVSTLGGYLESNPVWSFEASSRTLTIQKINKIYLGTRESLYIVVTQVKNPGQTTPTASFFYQTLDPQNFPVEFAGTGITFQATAGGFGFIDVKAQEKLINKIDVNYVFTMRPQDLFNENAVIKIVCPTQVWVDDGAGVQSGTSDIVTAVDSSTQVLFNRIIYVRRAFRNGGLRTLDTFEIIINGFTNPPTTQPTDSFQVSILYETGTAFSEISIYKGNGLFMVSEPSTALSIDASMTEQLTGELQSEFIIKGMMERYNPIEKQAYLTVKIPGGFTIENYDRVASTCTHLTGFSDEISCSFEDVSDPRFGNILVVKGGFDSETFTDLEFSFKIAEIRNPLMTQKTDSFEMQIFDRVGGLMYTANNEVELEARASPFAFVHVESLNPTNGIKSIYQVTITLGVDTSQGAYLEFTIPNEIVFEDSSGASVCRGTQNLAQQLSCVYVSDNTRRVNLVSDNPSVNTPHKSGTTIQFEIGYLRNPISLRSSSYFYLNSFFRTGTQRYLINESKRQVYSTNLTPGPIEIDYAYTTNYELNSETEMRVTFTTQSKIPQNSKLYVTLPSNIQIESKTQMFINSRLVSPIVNADAKQFVVDGLPEDGQDTFYVQFVGGLINPSFGPYTYEYLQIEFVDRSDYSIDKVIRNKPFVEAECTNNCDTCKDTRSKCTSCKYNVLQEKSFYLKASDFKCVDDCGSGYFKDSGYKCSSCQGNCLECTVSATSCTLCNPNSAKPYADPLSLRCYDKCPAGTYLDRATTLCTPCVSPCYTCNDKDTCTSCDRTDSKNIFVYFFQQELSCYQQCPNISVPTPSKQCDKCVAPCETCQNLPTQCVTCLEGSYLHKNNECVSECPFLYFENSELRKCTYFGELALPVPFSILAFVLTVGVGISAFVKGADKEGREQEGTAFFMTMLALVDMLLRLNWGVLAYVVFQKDYYVTFGLLIGLIVMSFFLNLFLWRRYFFSKYKYEQEDPLFSEYVRKNPATSSILIFFSYLLTFQAIRLTYSRFLGKKRFMAKFTRRLRYFRLIGRLTVLETLVLYLPAVAVNSWSLTYITDQKTTQFWLNVDGLALVLYAVILISVVLTQREKLMNYKSYFNFSELIKFGDDTDAEQFTNETEGNTVQTIPSKGSVKGENASMASLGGGVPASVSNVEAMKLQREEELEVRSATAPEDLYRQRLYQLDQRYGSNQDASNGRWHLLDEPASAFNKSNSQWTGNRDRTVSVIDYQEYRKLEDKRDRILLKKTLYERKKVGDEGQVVLLNDELNKYQKHKGGLNDRLSSLKKQLKDLQKNIVHVDKSRKKEVRDVEQEKRRDIIRRQGREVPYQSHSGVTSQSRSRSQLTKNSNTQVSKSPRDPVVAGAGPSAGGRGKKKRGGQRHQQSKSPRQSSITMPFNNNSDPQRSNQVDQSMVQSSNVMQEERVGPLPGQDMSKAAIDLQRALELQVETEKADNLRRPAIDRDGEQDTELADPSYPRMEIQETEEAIKMSRPIETLNTDEVEERVEEAAYANSNADPNHDNMTMPNLNPSPEPKRSASKQEPAADDDENDDENDDVW